MMVGLYYQAISNIIPVLSEFSELVHIEKNQKVLVIRWCLKQPKCFVIRENRLIRKLSQEYIQY